MYKPRIFSLQNSDIKGVGLAYPCINLTLTWLIKPSAQADGRLPSGGRCVSECQRREDRGNEGQGRRGCPPPTGEGFEEGVVPPSPENF